MALQMGNWYYNPTLWGLFHLIYDWFLGPPCGVPPFFGGACASSRVGLWLPQMLCALVSLSSFPFLDSWKRLGISKPLKFNSSPLKFNGGKGRLNILSYWVSVTFQGRTAKLREGIGTCHGVPTIARVDNMHRFIHEALRQSNIAIEN